MTGPRLQDLPFPVVLLGAVAVMCWLPAGHAAVRNDHQTAQAFLYSGLVLAVLCAMLALALQTWRRRPTGQARLAALVGAYLGLPLAMALPVLEAVPDTSLMNAWFEMVSCFTTTGASVYDPGRLPPSVHLWRAMMGWFGGFVILVAVAAILAPMNLGGAEVLSGRVPGRDSAGAGQGARLASSGTRLGRIARTVLPVYAGLTFLLWLFLLIGGEDGLLALTHAMGTLSTSGITAGVGLSVTGSGFFGEVLILAFLCLSLSRRFLPVSVPGLSTGPGLRDPELRLAALLVAVVVAILVTRHLMQDVPPAEVSTLTGLSRAIWGAAFTAVSFLTTTGYESAWWTSARDWAGLGAPGLLLLGLAIVGGGAATTAGGVKLIRVYALLRQGEHELDRIIHPSSVGGQGAEVRRLRREGAYSAWVFFMLFAISIALFTAALTLAGKAFEPALVLAISALTTTGPLAAVATAEPLSYAALGDPVKLILALAMVVGRVETLALVVLIAPGNWRR
jgi:trk system potassium uptake protein TrkH